MRGQRGVTLIELMIAGVIILVALLGFVGSMNEAARATAIGHRRTVAAQVRTALLERMEVTPRDRVQSMVADTWTVDACYDMEARVVATNAAQSTTFTCPDTALYRSWLRVEPSTAGAAGTRTWMVRTYAERLESPCDPAQRYSTTSCVAADLLLTD